eukprot:gene1363-6652_t
MLAAAPAARCRWGRQTIASLYALDGEVGWQGCVGTGGNAEAFHTVRKCDSLAAVLKRCLLGDGAAARDSALRDEAVFLSSLSHPNVIPLVDAFEEKRGGRWRLTVAMPFADGGTLCDTLDRARADGSVLAERWEWGRQLCEGVGYLHRMDVCHGDLKPDNILFRGARRVLTISDFGLSVRMVDGCVPAEWFISDIPSG